MITFSKNIKKICIVYYLLVLIHGDLPNNFKCARTKN